MTLEKKNHIARLEKIQELQMREENFKSGSSSSLDENPDFILKMKKVMNKQP